MCAPCADLVEVMRQRLKRFSHAFFRFLFDIINHRVLLAYETRLNGHA
jgi:hypothetical protein